MSEYREMVEALRFRQKWLESRMLYADREAESARRESARCRTELEELRRHLDELIGMKGEKKDPVGG